MQVKMWKDGVVLEKKNWHFNGQIMEDRNFVTGERQNWDSDGVKYPRCQGNGACLTPYGSMRYYDCEFECERKLCLKCGSDEYYASVKHEAFCRRCLADKLRP